MHKKLKISYLNDIQDVSNNTGVTVNQIIYFFRQNKLKLYDNKALFSDLILFCNKNNIEYSLLSVCNVIEEIRNDSNKYQKKYSKYTLAFFGHVNHGKTTLIMKIINREIFEEYQITQKVEIYSHKDLYLVDVPGHDIFYPLRKSLSHVMEAIVIVISLHKGIEQEIEKSLKFFMENELFYKCIVVFTKYDIKKYEPESIIEEIFNKYGTRLKYFLNNISSQKIYENLFQFVSLNYIAEKTHYDGLFLRKEVIDGNLYNLVKLYRGILDRKSFLLTRNQIVRVIKIKDVSQKYRDVNTGYGINYYYLGLDLNVDEYQEFNISKNQKNIYDYDKYLVAVYYLDTHIEQNKTQKSKTRETIAEKRKRRKERRMRGNSTLYQSNNQKSVATIVTIDSMTKQAIENLLVTYKVDKDYKVICYVDNNAMLYLMDCKKIIYFCCQKNNNIKYTGEVLEIDNIYKLIESIECAHDNVASNKTVENCAKITHLFNLRGVVIAGCTVIKGSFFMKDKVMVTVKKDDDENYILQDSVTANIVSLKKNTDFVKKVKINEQFGVTLGDFNDKLEIGMYIYKK